METPMAVTSRDTNLNHNGNHSLDRAENPEWLMKRATDVAGICKEIVSKTAMNIQGRKYVKIEGWQSIATTYGCILSARDVEVVDGGVRAIAEVRRISDGAIICTGEGFVGEDEPTWYGGEVKTRDGVKTLPKRANYAIRAMAQTRAMSRAARTAFAFVVVLMDAGLETTPAEEMMGMDDGGTMPNRAEQRHHEPRTAPQQPVQHFAPETTQDWREVTLHFGKHKDKKLGDLEEKSLQWYCESWIPKPYPEGSGVIKASDLFLRQALNHACTELGYAVPPQK